MAEKITGHHLQALTLLGGVNEEVRADTIFAFGQEDLLNAALDLVGMKFVNRRTQPDYIMPREEEIFYSLSEKGARYYQSIINLANQLNH